MFTYHLRRAALSFGFLAAALPAFSQSDGAPAFAFPVEQVSYANGAVKLSGGFLKPEGPFPALIIVHGAGPATFDGPAFRVHANAFVRAGFAVLCYDKRGSGKSTGDLDTSNYDDSAADLVAGVTYLRPPGRTSFPTASVSWASEGAGWDHSRQPRPGALRSLSEFRRGRAAHSLGGVLIPAPPALPLRNGETGGRGRGRPRGDARRTTATL